MRSPRSPRCTTGSRPRSASRSCSAGRSRRIEGAFAAAAEACGLGRDASALVEWYSELLTRLGIERRLPAAFKELEVAALIAEMQAPETQYMRRSSAREVSDADIAALRRTP